jgi:Ca2+/Na+ antiporter
LKDRKVKKVKVMKIVLIILFVLMAIFCFMGMIAEKDLKLRKTFTIAFFALVFCITMLALKPFKIEFYILVMFTVCMYLILFGMVFESFISRKQIKTITEYANVIKERNDGLCEANANLIERNKLIAERNEILAEKNNKLLETLDAIINGSKKDGE